VIRGSRVVGIVQEVGEEGKRTWVRNWSLEMKMSKDVCAEVVMGLCAVGVG
jgi:hypothetical protein